MIDSLWKSCLSACVAYGSHYCMTKLYSEICVPDTFYGFLQGMITSGSPVCRTLFSFMSGTQITYSTLVLGSLSRFCVDFFTDIHNCRIRKLMTKSKEEDITNE
jgi:hypothetical protein